MKKKLLTKKKTTFQRQKNQHSPPKMRKIQPWINSIGQAFAGIANLANENSEGNQHKTGNNITNTSDVQRQMVLPLRQI